MNLENEQGADEAAAQLSLPFLQDKIKRDHQTYAHEFSCQYARMESLVELFREKPYKNRTDLNELVMFVAQTCRFYEVKDKFCDFLMSTLTSYSDRMSRTFRDTLLSALCLLATRKMVSVRLTLPVYVSLLGSDERLLRMRLIKQMVKEIQVFINKMAPSRDEIKEVQHFLIRQMETHPNSRVQHRIISVVVSLYVKGILKDRHIVNAIAEKVFDTDVKVSGAAVSFLLGNKDVLSNGLIECNQEDEEEKKVAADLVAQVARGLVGTKKTKGKLRKLEKAKETAKKMMDRMERKKQASDTKVELIVLDQLYDPSKFAERALKRAMNGNDSMRFRLVLLTLIARVISRFKLLLSQLYPFLKRYLSPANQHVTRIAAIAAQSVHEEIPGSELEPVVTQLIDEFAIDANRTDRVVIGLRTLNEIVRRNIGAINREQLSYLADFMNDNKRPQVREAATSIVRFFRENKPEMLEQKVRGRAAKLQMREEDAQETGEIEGLDWLHKLKALRDARKETELEEGDEGEEERGKGDEIDEEDDALSGEDQIGGLDSEESTASDDIENEEGQETAASDEDEVDPGEGTEIAVSDQVKDGDSEVLTEVGHEAGQRDRGVKRANEEILSTEDYIRLKKIRLAIGVARSMGMSFEKYLTTEEGQERWSEMMESDGSDGSSSEGETETAFVDVEDVAYRKKAGKKDVKCRKSESKRSRQEERVKFGRKPSNEKHNSIPNKVKARNKPMAMVRNTQKVRDKQTMDARSKLASLRNHIKGMKKQTGGKKRFRKM